MVVLVLVVVLSLSELYDWRISANRRERHWKLFVACGASSIVLALVVMFLQILGLDDLVRFPGGSASSMTNRLILTILGAFLLLAVWRAFFHWAIARSRFHERLLLLGAGRLASTLAREVHERRDAGFEIVGIVAASADRPPEGESSPDPPLAAIHGDLDNLYEIARRLRVHRVIVALSDRRGNLPTEQLLRCRLEGISVEEWESLYERIAGRIAVESLRPSYLIFSGGFRKSRFAVAAKRTLDLFGATIGLVLTAPVSAAATVAILLDSRGPVFIRQPRVGKDGRPFILYKFRTMRADAERETGPVWAKVADERITRTGRVLRRVRIDELPQLLNVLSGDMSFVGPRPERPFFVEELKREIPYYTQRLSVKPGITGWAQVNWRYGSSKEDSLRKLQYDLYYIKNMSVLFDLLVLFRTIGVVFLRKGAV